MDLQPPASTDTVAQIVAYEQSRGASDWTGQQGSNDAWLLVQDWWNRGSYNFMLLCSDYNAALARIG